MVFQSARARFIATVASIASAPRWQNMLSIAEDYVKEERPTQTDIEALRNALFEVLIEMARGMSTTIEGRETVATLYEVRAIGMHPSRVTSVKLV